MADNGECDICCLPFAEQGGRSKICIAQEHYCCRECHSKVLTTRDVYGHLHPRCPQCRGDINRLPRLTGGATKCSVCRQTGHNRTNCPETTPEMRSEWSRQRRVARERAQARQQRHQLGQSQWQPPPRPSNWVNRTTDVLVQTSGTEQIIITTETMVYQPTGNIHHRIKKEQRNAEGNILWSRQGAWIMGDPPPRLDAHRRNDNPPTDRHQLQTAQNLFFTLQHEQSAPPPANVSSEDVAEQLIALADEQSPEELEVFISAMFD